MVDYLLRNGLKLPWPGGIEEKHISENRRWMLETGEILFTSLRLLLLNVFITSHVIPPT